MYFQEEFKRLYAEIENLKQRNMKLNNPHLNNKLFAMQEAVHKYDSVETANALPQKLQIAHVPAANPESPLLQPTSNGNGGDSCLNLPAQNGGKRVVITLENCRQCTQL